MFFIVLAYFRKSKRWEKEGNKKRKNGRKRNEKCLLGVFAMSTAPSTMINIVDDCQWLHVNKINWKFNVIHV